MLWFVGHENLTEIASLIPSNLSGFIKSLDELTDNYLVHWFSARPLSYKEKKGSICNRGKQREISHLSLSRPVQN